MEEIIKTGNVIAQEQEKDQNKMSALAQEFQINSVGDSLKAIFDSMDLIRKEKARLFANTEHKQVVEYWKDFMDGVTSQTDALSRLFTTSSIKSSLKAVTPNKEKIDITIAHYLLDGLLHGVKQKIDIDYELNTYYPSEEVHERASIMLDRCQSFLLTLVS